MLKPFPYQKTGARFLSERKFAILGDEMGVGKSAQAIIAADIVKAKRIIVVCKAVGRENWRNEFTKFSPNLRYFNLVWNRDTFNPPNDSVTVCSYDTLGAVLKATVGRFDLAIIDEAHAVKTPTAQRTKLVYGKDGLFPRTDRLWALSGTIAPNNAAELWIHLYICGRTKLSYQAFIDRYCLTRNAGYGEQIIGNTKDPEILNELKSNLKPIFLRRLSEDDEVKLDLPEIFFQEIIVHPGKVQLDLSRKFEVWLRPEDRTAELNAILEQELGILKAIVGQEFKNEVVEALIAQSNSISTVRAYMAQQKVEPVYDLVSGELEDGQYQKIVIFCHHRDLIVALERKFDDAGYRYITLYGGLDPKKIQKRIDEFQNQKGCQIALANIEAAGTTITLTAANQVLFAEQDFNDGKNAQAIKRIHRLGQKKPCFVRVVSLANSFDQQVNRILARKAEDTAKLMDDEGKIRPKTILRTRQLPPKTDIGSIA